MGLWIALAVIALAVVGMVVASWLEERAWLRNAAPGAFIDWHDD